VTQVSIPIQPGETAVTAALRAFADGQGWCVTATTNGQHAAASLHYSGRAVDLASRAGPGTDTNDLLNINEKVVQLLPLSSISELIYAGPGNVCVHNGQIVNGLLVYGTATMAEHHNHVHLGVIPTFSFTSNTPAPAPATVVKPVYDPPLQVVDFLPYLHGSGGWGLLADGGVAAFGDAPYRGTDKQPIGHDYWGNRKAAKFERNGEGYDIIDTAGERYSYP
jgi:hypothetical protein